MGRSRNPFICRILECMQFNDSACLFSVNGLSTPQSSSGLFHTCLMLIQLLTKDKVILLELYLLYSYTIEFRAEMTRIKPAERVWC
jgi:hypothetical protein